MTRYQTCWVKVIIIVLVVVLRSPTLLPSMYVSDEGYYGTIANDILDGGAVYHTAVDTKPPGMYYIYAAVFQVAGRNNLLAVHDGFRWYARSLKRQRRRAQALND